ncbi:hypothetical protein HYPDE_41313 [Hyphomicrobium denitrificans 1NES1]|uniref:Helix-turn-helix domain-containing protein n=1 Tax=Hyphomicrobium denitrificans 1NES1 TaxID=670307 RepID=N0BHL9_9HYPH|nr:helix-turn-helix domain-containing protein [Hyphomicrobium denitrificans]AGK59931.1 hypothetical protein HYPDE_41313 [Hyphomicrobium denitrificans 1NES1]
MGIDWNKQRTTTVREKLLPAQDEARIIKQYGEAIRPVLDHLLDEKAAELANSYDASWRKLGEYLTAETREQTAQQLLSHEEVARMLGSSVATVKRMVQDGRLPKPVQISERRIGHRYADIKKLTGKDR